MTLEEDKTLISQSATTTTAPKEGSLIQIYGPNLGQRYVLDQAEHSIGRDAANDIVIDSDTVSRNHAHIFVINQQVVLKDLGSTNETRVNQRHVDRCVLRDGDTVQWGRLQLEVRLPSVATRAAREG